MLPKSIVTFVCDPSTDQQLLKAAVTLTGRMSGHLTVYCLGIDRTNPGVYYAGANAIALQRTLAEAEKNAIEAKRYVNQKLEREDIDWSCLAIVVQIGALSGEVASRAQLADLILLPKPYGPDRGAENVAIIESALFGTDVPVLVLPDAQALADTPDRIVVAWNQSKEALSAIRNALPFLAQAAVVNIVIIDPPTHSPDRSDPGGALAEMLARHGVNTEISVLPRTMSNVSDILTRHTTEKNADMLVMGAYGHSRLREAILGGATRDMLEKAQIPILMAH